MIAAAIIVAAIAFVLYVLAGYPLTLALLTRRRTVRTKKEFHPHTVSVMLAVHNGEQYIEAKLDTLNALDYPRDLMEVFVLSDGSTDRTHELVQARAAFDPRIKLLVLPRGGKCRALSAGIAAASGEVLFFTDIRQELSPNSLRDLVACFADETVGAVSGELILLDQGRAPLKSVGLYWKYEKWIRFRQSDLGTMLGATGCVYAMRRELARPIPAHLYLDDVYQPLQAFFQGRRVILEAKAQAFDLVVPLENEFRRKVRTQAGVYQILGQFPQLLAPWTPMAYHFFWHKLGRLWMPFALIAILIASFFLPDPWRMLMLAGQAAFYGAALLDGFLPEGFALKKLTSPIRTFVVLFAAALWAAVAVFQPSEKVWKS